MNLLTIEEAALVLTVSPSTAQRLVKSGTLPSRRIGKQIRIAEEDIDAFLEAARTPAREAVNA